MALPSLQQRLNTVNIQIGKSDLNEKDWCSACTLNEGNVCLQRFSVRHTEAEATENVCQLLSGVTILLQGMKERMKGGI